MFYHSGYAFDIVQGACAYKCFEENRRGERREEMRRLLRLGFTGRQVIAIASGLAFYRDGIDLERIEMLAGPQSGGEIRFLVVALDSVSSELSYRFMEDFGLALYLTVTACLGLIDIDTRVDYLRLLLGHDF